jgi:hypothetical protein
VKRAVAILLLATTAAGDSYPPGDYNDVGLVVRRANGDYDLFSGWGCLLELQDNYQRLKPYLGKFVRLDYTRVEAKEGDNWIWDHSGAPIGKIRKVTVLPDTPLRVTARAPKKAFSLAEPVTVELTVRNAGNKKLTFDRADFECNLMRDYRAALEFRPPAKKEPHTLHPGDAITFRIRSDLMAKPGKYRAILVHALVDDRPILSNFFPVEVTKPANEAQMTAALKTWLPRAEPMQRVEIAKKLHARGEQKLALATVIHLLTSNTKMYSHYHVYEFLWAHGDSTGRAGRTASAASSRTCTARRARSTTSERGSRIAAKRPWTSPAGASGRGCATSPRVG